MPTLIQNARILTPFSQQDGSVLVTGDRIVEVSRDIHPPRNTTVIDAKNLYLVPGYIDMHIHGTQDYSVMEGTPEAIVALANACAKEGTTTILPTTSTAPLAEIEKAIDAAKKASTMPCEGTIAGIHLQGPFLSPVFMTGSQKEHLLVPAEVDWKALLKRWDGIRMMGIAPELPGAFELAEALQARGAIPSIAYSDANYDLVLSSISHGFSDVTDLFTHSSTLHEKGASLEVGVAESALAMEELSVQVVADGRRLPLILLQIITKCKAAESILLVSDAACGEDNAYAGANKTNMALMVRNMVASGVSLRVALRMATVNPARRLGLESSKGRIGNGYDADMLLLDESLNVRFVMSMGKVLHNELDEIK